MNITSKKVLQFYKNNPHFEINTMNEMFVDLITNLLSQTPKQNMDENTITVLLKSMQQNINNIHSSQTLIASEFNALQKSMIDSVQLQLLTSKNEYIKELEKSISATQNNSFEKHQSVANANHEKLLDKLRIHFNDQFKATLDTQFKQISSDISSEFTRAHQTGDMSKFENAINNKYELLYNFILQNNQEFRTQLSKMDCTEEISQIKGFFDRQKNSSNKGNDGENKLESILNEIFPTANVINTTGTSKSGDFMVKRDDAFPIMFENKDYSNNVNVPYSEVEKFIRDVEYTNTHSIFLSQGGGIATKRDFHIDMYENNVMIYVHNVKYSPEKINVAIVMLDHLVSKLEQLQIKGDTISEDTMRDINAEYKLFVSHKTNSIELLRKFNKDLLKELNDIELPELGKILVAKYATTDTTTSKCSDCNKEFKNAKGLAAHQKWCAKRIKNKN